MPLGLPGLYQTHGKVRQYCPSQLVIEAGSCNTSIFISSFAWASVIVRGPRLQLGIPNRVSPLARQVLPPHAKRSAVLSCAAELGAGLQPWWREAVLGKHSLATLRHGDGHRVATHDARHVGLSTSFDAGLRARGGQHCFTHRGVDVWTHCTCGKSASYPLSVDGALTHPVRVLQ